MNLGSAVAVLVAVGGVSATSGAEPKMKDLLGGYVNPPGGGAGGGGGGGGGAGVMAAGGGGGGGAAPLSFVDTLDKGARVSVPDLQDSLFRAHGARISQSTIAKALDDAGKKPESIHQEFLKHFGVGLGVTGFLGGRDPIKKATLDGAGIVRVDEEDEAEIGLVLEAHQLWYPKAANRRLGVGPFVSVKSDSDEVFQSVGMGLMFSFRFENDADRGALNIGLGAFLDPEVQVLGDGIAANQALPAGDALRFKEEARFGWMVVVSFGF